MNIKYASLFLVLNVIGVNAMTNSEKFDTLGFNHTVARYNYDECQEAHPHAKLFFCGIKKIKQLNTERLFTDIANEMKKPLNNIIQNSKESNNINERIDGNIAMNIKATIENAENHIKNGHFHSLSNIENLMTTNLEETFRKQLIASDRLPTNINIKPSRFGANITSDPIERGHKTIKELCGAIAQ